MKPRGRSMAERRYFLFVALLAGCASKTNIEPVAGPLTGADDVLSRLVNTDNGLELHRWVVSDDAGVIGAALLRYQEGETLGPNQADALRRAGLRLVRVSEQRMQDLLRDLDTAPVEVSAWHGQIFQWRQLRQRRTPQEGTVITAGGRVYPLERGRLKLMARSWTVQMEDAPYLNLELLPEFELHETRAPFRKLLGYQGLTGQVFTTARVEFLMQPGFAYVLVSESPDVMWAEASSGNVPQTARPAAVGPITVMPETLGEFLLTDHGLPGRRIMLVFVALIPERLFEPYVVPSEADGVVDQ